jgi:DNA repair exonuclease SbcCD ATPase subunit
MPVIDKFRELKSGFSDRISAGISDVKEKLSDARGKLQTNQDILSRSDELQATDAALNENTATANDVETLQKRLDAIEQMLNNLDADFRRLLYVFTSNFHTRYPPDSYNAFRDIMRTQMKKILEDISQRGQ